MFILIACIVIVVSLVLASRLMFGWQRSLRPTVTWDELRTGDILYTSTPGPGAYLFSLAGIQGGHAMMIVRDKDDVNVLEISGYRDNPAAEARPCIRPLGDRFDTPYKLYGTIWRYQGEEIEPQRIYEYLELVRDCGFNYSFVGEHVKQRFTGYLRDVQKDRLCCSELVYLALVHVGVLKFNKYDWSDSFRYLMALPKHSVPHDLLCP